MRYSIILSALTFALIGYSLMRYMRREQAIIDNNNQENNSQAQEPKTAEIKTERKPSAPTTPTKVVEKESLQTAQRKPKDAVDKLTSYGELKEVLGKNPSGTQVVKCSAVWCGPCRTMAPIFNRIAQELSDVAQFYAIDTDRFAGVDNLNIRGVPTFIIYKNGKEASRLVGARSYDAFKTEIEKAIS